jgi:photosystem II stability/assembly factor-like uncharacterized protein
VRKTTNGGLNWINQSVYSGNLYAMSFSDENTGFVSTYGGIYLTTNSGSNWTLKFNSEGNELYTLDFFNVNTGIAAGYRGLMYRTTDMGTSWTSQTNYLTTQELRSLYSTGTEMYAVGDSGKCLYSSNNGNNWNLRNIPTAMNLYSVAFSGSNVIAVGQNSKVFRSTNSGTNWIIDSTARGSKANHRVQLLNSTTGYISSDSGRIFKTTNSGNNWVLVAATGAYDEWLGMYFTDVNTGYICTYSGALKKTTDGGVSWTAQNSNTVYTLTSISFINTNTGIASGYGGKVIITTNGGVNWTEKTAAEYGYFWDAKFANSNTGYAVGSYGVVSKSTDGGSTWFQMQDFTYKNLYSAVFTDGLTGMVCGSDGLITKTTTGGVTFVKNTGYEKPVDYCLHQNYPNPFNPTTKIDFDLPKSSNVKITLFDILGREIMVVLNEFRQSGRHTVEVNGEHLTSGVYFYCLRSDDGAIHSVVRKMVLIK